MTLEQAIQIIEALIVGDADCRCGNFAISDEDIEALKTLIRVIEDKDE